MVPRYFRIQFARGVHDPKEGCAVAAALMYDHKRVSQQFQESYAENRSTGSSNSKKPSPIKAQSGGSKFSVDQGAGIIADDGTLPTSRPQSAGGSARKTRGGSPPRKSDGREGKSSNSNFSSAGDTFDFASAEVGGGERDSGTKSGANSSGQGSERQGTIFKLSRFKDAPVAELACLEQVCACWA